MKRFLDLQQHLSRPDAVELQQRNLASGLNQAVPVYSERPATEDLSERSAWVSFQDDIPALEAHVDGVIYSVALSADGTSLPPPSTSPVFRSSSVGTSGGAASIAINTPAGVVDGDVMLAFLAIGGNDATITPPAGWTLITRVDNSNIVSLVTYWISAGASPPSSYTWTGLNDITAATILAYSGANSAPIDTYNSEAGPFSTTTTPSSPAVTTSVDNSMVLRAYSIVVATTGASSVSVTPPAGYTNRGQAQFSSGSTFAATAEVSDVLRASAGSSAAVNASTSALGYYTSQTIAIRP